MNILAFDTSSTASSAALVFEDASSKESKTLSLFELAPKQHTSIILPMIQSLLDSASLTMANIHAIAFGAGPGSLTGTRIAVSLAKGLAYAQGIPVIPVSSLAAAAQSAYLQHGWERLIVAVDARMEQLYFAAYRIENKVVSPIINDLLSTAADLPAITDEQWYGVGDGFTAYGEVLKSRYQTALAETDPDVMPTAEAVLCIAKEKFSKGDVIDAADAQPVYLR